MLEEYSSLPLYDYGNMLVFPGMVDEMYHPLVFSEAIYLATKGGGTFFGKIVSFEEEYEFDAVVLDDDVLPHPQILNLAERME